MKIGLIGNGKMGKCFIEHCPYQIVGVVSKTNLNSCFAYSEIPQVLVDFSHPSMIHQILEYATLNHCKCILGTTGYSEAEMNLIKETAKTNAIVYSANYSIGLQAMKKMVHQLSTKLSDYDIELVETHHRLKKDAPSGTSLLLYDSLKKAQSEYVLGHTSKRQDNAIGIHAVRGGNGFSKQSVLFLGDHESIECTYSSQGNLSFIKGALLALEYIKDKEVGLFTMDEVLWK